MADITSNLEKIKELATSMDKHRPAPWNIGDGSSFVCGPFVESSNSFPICVSANNEIQNYLMHCDPKTILSLIHAVEISIDAFHWAGKWHGKHDGSLQTAYNNIEKELGNIH